MQFDSTTAKRAGRKSAKSRSEYRTFDSMAACAGALGIPVSHLSLIKATGCPAFVHSKVREKALIRWIVKHREVDENTIEPTDENALAYRADRYLAANIRRLINEYRDSVGLPHWPWRPGQAHLTPTAEAA